MQISTLLILILSTLVLTWEIYTDKCVCMCIIGNLAFFKIIVEIIYSVYSVCANIKWHYYLTGVSWAKSTLSVQ